MGYRVDPAWQRCPNALTSRTVDFHPEVMGWIPLSTASHCAKVTSVEVTSRTGPSTQVVTIAGLPPCIVAMEACAPAHYWTRKNDGTEHTVRPAPSPYV